MCRFALIYKFTLENSSAREDESKQFSAFDNKEILEHSEFEAKWTEMKDTVVEDIVVHDELTVLTVPFIQKTKIEGV